MDIPGPAFAFMAGVLTIFSPCGYPLLPGYLARYLGSKPSIKVALAGSVLCTFGLTLVFAALGVLPSVFGALVYQYIPWMIPVSGTIVVIMGLGMIFGLEFPKLYSFSSVPQRAGLGGFVLYGIAYGMAALGCSAPIFLSVVVFAFHSGGFLRGATIFLVYALGMGLTLTAISIVFAKAGEVVLHKFTSGLQTLRRSSGVLLVAVGLYLIYYFYTVYQTSIVP